MKPPAELTASDVARLAQLLGIGGSTAVHPPSNEDERQKRRKCKKQVELTRNQVRQLVELIKPHYVPGFRNALLYAMLGVFWRSCVSEESIRAWYEELQAWATSVYSDVDRRHDDYILEGVLSGRDWHLFGWRRLRETLIEVYKQEKGCAPGDDRCEMAAKAAALEVVDEIKRVLGLRRRWLILISARGVRAGRNAELYYANHPSVGLAVFKKYVVCKKECVEVNERGKCVKKAEVCKTEWGFDVAAKHVYIERGIVYVDPLTDHVLYSVKLRDLRTGKAEWLRYVTVDDVVQRIKQIGAVGVPTEELTRVVQSILAETAVKVKRPPVAGVLPDAEGRPWIAAYGPYADRLKQVLNSRGDPAKFVELLDRFYQFNPKALEAYAVGLYMAFNAFRKRRGLRNKWLVLSGEAGTGKTQLAKTIVSYIFNLPEEGETESGAPPAVHSAGALLSPARLARDLAFTTFPKLFDEGRTLTFSSPAVADTIKRAINGLFAYETATAGSLITRQYPAYAAAIITTQAISVSDPGLKSKLYNIEFTQADVKRGHEEFLRWREAHREDLRAFGKFYLETIIHERPDLLEVDEDRYVWAAREALRHVLAKLGAPEGRIRFPETEEGGEADEDELATFVKWLTKTCRAHLMDLPPNERVKAEDPADVVEHVLRKFGGLRDVDVVIEGDTVKIGREVVDKIGGTNLKNLAEKINTALSREAAQYAKLGGRKRLTINIDDLRELVKKYA